ncbi:hypothetical protein [Streptomyces sp. M2CJ-2]|uniref:hypothetical protein n=1 Tax=Streptomyces sp. M2CJ-2 TaxID=2803948 RepID=UPI001F486ED1|nr:hypothetical protein [Streptomyces sp. M2CJ-2]
MIDIVVRAGSSSGRALAAGPDSSPAATTEAVMVAAHALRPAPVLLALLVLLVFLVLNPFKRMGS